MNQFELLSDQLFKWSENHANSLDHRAQTSAQATAAQTPAVGWRFAWLVDRALQALRQTGLQVRQWSGTWTEVLLVGESYRCSTDDELRSAGHSAASLAIPCQLPRNPRHTRSALRDQPRVAAPPGTVLGAGGEREIHKPHRHLRYHCRCDADGQHARGVAARAQRFPPPRGGAYR